MKVHIINHRCGDDEIEVKNGIRVFDWVGNEFIINLNNFGELEINGKKNSVNRITKINTTTSRLDCRSRSLKSLTIRSGSKRSDGLRLLSIVEFQTTLVLSPVPFQRTVLVNISYQFL